MFLLHRKIPPRERPFLPPQKFHFEKWEKFRRISRRFIVKENLKALIELLTVTHIIHRKIKKTPKFLQLHRGFPAGSTSSKTTFLPQNLLIFPFSHFIQSSLPRRIFSLQFSHTPHELVFHGSCFQCQKCQSSWHPEEWAIYKLPRSTSSVGEKLERMSVCQCYVPKCWQIQMVFLLKKENIKTKKEIPPFCGIFAGNGAHILFLGWMLGGEKISQIDTFAIKQ